MRKFILFLIVIMSLVISVNAIEGAGIVEASGLNIRQLPTTDSSIIMVIYNQERVVVEYQEGEWYKINYQGTEGYVHSDYMSIITIANGNYGKAIPNYYAVNVREKPTTNSAVLTTIGNSSSVNIIGINSGWYKITVNGLTGYIRADLLDITGKASSTTPTSSVVSTAMNYIGVPYVWGGTSPNGFDCSGFVQYIFKQYGYNLNRTAAAQYSNGYSISRSELRPGDVVFFANTYTYGISHVGIYTGNNQFIHAGTNGITTDSLDSSYYASHYYGARRIF